MDTETRAHAAQGQPTRVCPHLHIMQLALRVRGLLLERGHEGRRDGVGVRRMAVRAQRGLGLR